MRLYIYTFSLGPKIEILFSLIKEMHEIFFAPSHAVSIDINNVHQKKNIDINNALPYQLNCQLFWLFLFKV